MEPSAARRASSPSGLALDRSSPAFARRIGFKVVEVSSISAALFVLAHFLHSAIQGETQLHRNVVFVRRDGGAAHERIEILVVGLREFDESNQALDELLHLADRFGFLGL